MVFSITSGVQLHSERQAPEPRVQRHHVGVSVHRPGRPGVSLLSGVVRPDPLPSHRGTYSTCFKALMTVDSLEIIPIALPSRGKTGKTHLRSIAVLRNWCQRTLTSFDSHCFIILDLFSASFYARSQASVNTRDKTCDRRGKTPTHPHDGEMS